MIKINKNFLVAVGVILIVVIIVSAHQLFKSKEKTPISGAVPVIINDLSKNGSRSDQDSLNNKKVVIPDQVEQLSHYGGRPINSVKYGPGFIASPDLINKHKQELNVLAGALAKDPFNVNDWITVGVIKKFFNDYEGARDAWVYATLIFPSDPLAFANLGNLYGFYLHDNAQAELNYQKAISNNPYEPSYYIGLADFYKNVYTDKKSEVPQVILSGASMIKDVNLYLYLASYYRDTGDKTNAVKYYQEVLKMSPNQAGVQAEVDRLK